MKIIIVLALVAVIAALGSAGFFMLRRSTEGDSRDKRMARALAVRVGLSVSIFLFILFAHSMGWIEPTGVPLPK